MTAAAPAAAVARRGWQVLPPGASYRTVAWSELLPRPDADELAVARVRAELRRLPVDRGRQVAAALAEVWTVTGDDAPARVRLRERTVLPAGDPFRRLGGREDLWVRLRVGRWGGYARLPASWLGFAYRVLGLAAAGPTQATGEAAADDEPAGDPPAGDNPIDRAVTAFVVEKTATALARRLGVPVEAGEPRTAANLGREVEFGRELSAASAGWLAVRVDVELAGQTWECAVTWPAVDAAAGGSAAAGGWLGELCFAASVLAGDARLARGELRDLKRGDIVLPDRWLPGVEGLVDTPPGGGAVVDEGAVLLALQGRARRALLRTSAAGRREVEITSPSWLTSAKGWTMLDDTQQSDPEGGSDELTAWSGEAAGGAEDGGNDGPAESPEGGGPAAVSEAVTAAFEPPGAFAPDELEVVMSFELDRLPVTLRDLAEWQEGTAIALDRRPDDPVRILLEHGGGSRLAGYGRVVVIDGRLGVRIDDWRADSG